EVNLINDNWSPTNGNITTFTESISGKVMPFTLTTSQFTYSDNVSAGAANKTNIVEINGEYPKQTFSYGSYGIHMGVKFSIPKKEKSVTTPDAQIVP
ncbi:MAG TPA: hypothetical protein VK809_07080, partial [Bacteroidia bacterium]|nr:hypothetical protein [Bacteroidia bacterium]